MNEKAAAKEEADISYIPLYARLPLHILIGMTCACITDCKKNDPVLQLPESIPFPYVFAMLSHCEQGNAPCPLTLNHDSDEC